MSAAPRVSVIIPSYNHEKFVGQAIWSVLEQTFQDFEIVITDDGSSDGTVREIRKFDDPRIRFYEFGKNRGAAVASTHCVSQAKGDYVAMLCSDDAFLPEKLEKQVRLLDSRPDIAAVFSYARIIDERGEEFRDRHHVYYSIFRQPNRTRREWLNHFFYNENCLCHTSVLARREIYSANGSDPRYAQLGDFNRWMKICLRHGIHVIPEELVLFRVRRNDLNASGRRPEVLARHAWEFSQILKNYLEIKTADEFFKVFPEARRFGECPEDGLVPYFLARLALERPLPYHHAFGLETLFNLMADARMADKLRETYGFAYRDFIRLTAACDIFRFGAMRGMSSQIFRTPAWKLLLALYGMTDSLFPIGTKRRMMLESLFKRKHRPGAG